MGMQTIDQDYIEDLIMTTNHHYIMFFTNTGRVYRLKTYAIPEGSRTARGTAIINLLQLLPGEKHYRHYSDEGIRRRQVPIYGDKERYGKEDPDDGIRQCQKERTSGHCTFARMTN